MRQVLVIILLLIPTFVSAQEIYIRRDDCRWLAKHPPGGADYVPGVAADGSAVAPADLSPPPQLPSDIVITLSIDVLERYGIGPTSPLLDSEAHLGVVVVRGQQVFFNGQELGSAEKALLSAECKPSADGD